MTETHWYMACGLRIASELEVPEFGAAEPGDADLKICFNNRAAAALARVDLRGPFPEGVLRTPDGLVLSVAGVGEFLVPDGSAIHITRAAGFDAAKLRLYLLGTVTAMVLHHRQRLVLHGAAVLNDGAISVFVGDSGAGKSTLAAHLAKRGHAVITDDVLSLEPGDDARLVGYPGSHMFKLWQDSLDTLGRRHEGLSAVGARATKFFVPNATHAPQAAAPLAEVFELMRCEGPPRVEDVPGLAALPLVERHVFRPGLVEMIGDVATQFRHLTTVATTARVSRLYRPWDIASMDAVLDLIEDHWRDRRNH